MEGWYYKTTDDNTSRFVLGTKGQKPIICFGINPSTAVPNELDQTLRSVQRIALNNGYDSWIMLNVYPQRATCPDELHEVVDMKIHRKNLSHIERLIETICPLTIWAAWGTLIEKRKYLQECLSDIVELTSKYDCSWVSFGNITKKGHPHHPLFVGQFQAPDDFNIKDYLAMGNR